ncbi:tryptophan halogenase family protein [Sphingomonas desiccabilis]|uniref:Tryptophan 7-halogenase n=1 Tax=Sphingomonas desiccabilis TaxID=429134 RepID=A0A4Q2IMF4_9SPHN|nr:tryptophan halogenase family protein [Sphingomonas desiccabilis]MBB3912364.1 tryptophan halogenase [Sphingomonas desiccabilis]RXZ30500.1 tryptophan 7-halogenase [Sphingomonas desiccabilis]
MNEHTIRNVVIVGGGTAGWMAAAAFSRFLNNGVTRITLVESEEIGTVGVGEATIPPLLTFNRMLGINENDFIRETGGTYKLGIEFDGWGEIGERYFHPFGSHGHDLGGVHFHQLYLRERKRRVMQDISAWSMSAVAAQAGKFARPAEGAQSAVKELLYAFHFDASLYARFLRRYAEAGGVQRIEGKIAEVAVRPDDGHVAALKLDNGQTVDGDLFIDCSGFRGLLIEEALETGYEDWSRWLPCDRAVAVPSRYAGDPDPFTRATARGAGWQWRIPLQQRMGNGLVYCSDFMTAEAAERELLANLEGEPLAEPRHLSFVTGRRKLGWNRNVVALGLSSGFVEPLESTSIHLVQSGIAKLIALFPDRRFNPVERDEYNRQMRDLYEDVRDFVILHYKATRRRDTPFWDRCRTMDVPETLQRKIDLFRAKGRIFREAAELFATTSWVAVCLGQHIVPEEHEPAADALDEDKVAGALEQMRQGYLQVAAQLPTHGDFLRHTGASLANAPAPPQPAEVPGEPSFSFASEKPFNFSANPL